MKSDNLINRNKECKKKAYRLTYGFSWFLGFSYIMILILIALLPFYFHLNSKEILSLISALFAFILLFFIIFLIVNGISKIFTSPCVFIDKEAIYYSSSIILLDHISRIEFDCGELGGKGHRGEPTSVTILGIGVGCIYIKRPPLLLMFKLIRKCGRKFKIKNIKRILFLWPSLVVIGGVIIYFIQVYFN